MTFTPEQRVALERAQQAMRQCNEALGTWVIGLCDEDVKPGGYFSGWNPFLDSLKGWRLFRGVRL